MDSPSMFQAMGPEAKSIVKLWWILLGIGTFVFVTISYLVIRGWLRSTNSHEAPIDERKLQLVVGGAVAASALLLIVIIVATLKFSNPALTADKGESIIEVIGKLWWWEVRYKSPDGKLLFTTANEIRIPVNTPVRLRLLTDNVIHSFWVPELAGKMDLIPGRVNELTIRADAKGIFRGQCAEYCGIQHALMAFHVVAQDKADFRRWKEWQMSPAIAPEDRLALRGQEVFRESKCASCHTVKGLSKSELGPDLTHLMSRSYLAAGTIPNRKGHLGGWITDPQGIKPGNLMPSTPLPSEDFHALMTYLEALR